MLPGLFCPGAFSQFPLPLQANAVGEPIVRTKLKAAAESKDVVSFIDLLHATHQRARPPRL